MKRLDRPLTAAAIAAVLYAWFIGHRLEEVRFDASQFVGAGDYFCDARQTPASLRTITPRSTGYDGQFYYRLSLKPFSRASKELGIAIDAPAYRQQRILYPFLSWILSGFGRSGAVPWSLIAVNWLALLLIAYASGAIAQRAGSHALWGLIVALYPGFLFSLCADLTEIVEASMIVMTVYQVQRGRQDRGALFLSLAVLAKEVALVLPLAVLAVFVWQKVRTKALPEGRAQSLDDRAVRWTLWVFPLAVFCVWHVVLRLIWGEFPLAAAQQLRGTPFTALIAFARKLLPPRGLLHRYWATDLMYLGLLAVIAIGAARKASLPAWVRLGVIGYALLGASLNADIWLEDRAFMRALAEFATLALLTIVSGKTAARPFVLSLTAVTWGIVAYGLL